MKTRNLLPEKGRVGFSPETTVFRCPHTFSKKPYRRNDCNLIRRDFFGESCCFLSPGQGHDYGLARVQQKRGSDGEMKIADPCSVEGCDQRSIVEIDLRQLCLVHFITTCERRLAELSENMQLWSSDQVAREMADRFTKECFERGTDILQQQPEPAMPERARLLEILFWATQLRGQLQSIRA